MPLATRRLRRDLNVSDPTAGIVVPAETMFVFNGSSADLAQQFYQRYEAGAMAAKLDIDSDALPQSVQARLAAVDLKFKHLHPLLQRALLWDSGYVFASDSRGGGSTGKLLRVYTANGMSMAEIAVSTSEFTDVAGCATANCSASSPAQRSTGTACSGARLAPVLKCAVEGDVESSPESQAFWATGGHERAIPELSVARHTWQDGSAAKQTYTVNAIHSIALAREAAVGCTAASSGGQYSSLIIPCAQYSPSSGASDAGRVWADPAPGALVSVWLQHARADKPGFNQYYTLLIIAGALAGIVLLLVMSCSCKSRYRRRKLRRAEAKMTSADPSALLESDDAIVVSAVALTPVHVMLESDLEASDSSHDWKNACGASQAVAGRRLRMDQLAFRKLLAHGAGGSEVWTAKYHGSRVAVKRRPTLSAAATGAAAGGSLKPSRPGAAAATPTTATAPPEINAELELLASLHHRNIVRFYGVAWNSPDSLCIVTEYARKSSLEEYLRPRQRGSSDSERLTWMQVQKIMAGVADALQYLHAREPPVAHGALEARNVLLSSRFEAKLIGVGGPAAAATAWPRSLEDDICALGVLFAELIAHCEHAAASGARASFVHEEHKIERESLPPPPVCTLEIREIVARCMTADPSARPRIGDVVRVFPSSSGAPTREEASSVE
ncbi:hypothetical protein PybrP1_011930 [[Pythium] brassicae (nom. inval.)]|nr:hypothetical protein PybrP1_011930 [[Pythium] brassicae (nom. inval.)]